MENKTIELREDENAKILTKALSNLKISISISRFSLKLSTDR